MNETFKFITYLGGTIFFWSQILSTALALGAVIYLCHKFTTWLNTVKFTRSLTHG